VAWARGFETADSHVPDRRSWLDRERSVRLSADVTQNGNDRESGDDPGCVTRLLTCTAATSSIRSLFQLEHLQAASAAES